VIVDSHPIHKRSWRKFLDVNGKRVSDADLGFIMDGRKREVILRHFLGELSDDQVQVLGRQKEQLFREEAVDLTTVRGVLEFLPLLRQSKIKMGVASSGSTGRVNYILNSLSLRHYFSVVVTGDQVAKGKPDPSIFELACRHLQVDASQALVFEDSVSGVKAAKAAGTKCIGIDSNGASPLLIAAGADEVIPDFSAFTFDRMQRMFH
jgi:HAD superfamily hydrolase (TIGR01509 family)